MLSSNTWLGIDSVKIKIPIFQAITTPSLRTGPVAKLASVKGESESWRVLSRGKIIHEPRKLVSQILIQSETLVWEVFLRVLPAAIFFFFLQECNKAIADLSDEPPFFDSTDVARMKRY